MINEFEFFHGAALITISQASKKPITIESLKGSYENSAYILNNSMGLYIKHSKKRLSPWIFTFHKKHQDTIKELNDIYGKSVLLLICNSDGIVGLDFQELKKVLDNKHTEIEWIRVERTKGKLYKVTGSDGALEFKVGMTDYINKALI
jgi:hypothetical protein